MEQARSGECCFLSLRQREGDGTLSGQITEGNAVLGQPDGQQAVASGKTVSRLVLPLRSRAVI